MAGSWLAFADDCTGCSTAYSVDLCVLMLLDGVLPSGAHRVQAKANKNQRYGRTAALIAGSAF